MTVLVWVAKMISMYFCIGYCRVMEDMGMIVGDRFGCMVETLAIAGFNTTSIWIMRLIRKRIEHKKFS